MFPVLLSLCVCTCLSFDLQYTDEDERLDFMRASCMMLVNAVREAMLVLV